MTRRLAPFLAAALVACAAPSPGPEGPAPVRQVGVAAVVATVATPDPRKKPKPYIHTKAERSIKPSLYRGKWFRHKDETKRRCIVWRESNGRYRVVNRSSGSAGAYQFMLATSNYVARDLIGRPGLVGVPASAWPRKTQDRAFWRLWANGKGKNHWRGGNWSCGF